MGRWRYINAGVYRARPVVVSAYPVPSSSQNFHFSVPMGYVPIQTQSITIKTDSSVACICCIRPAEGCFFYIIVGIAGRPRWPGAPRAVERVEAATPSCTQLRPLTPDLRPASACPTDRPSASALCRHRPQSAVSSYLHLRSCAPPGRRSKRWQNQAALKGKRPLDADSLRTERARKMIEAKIALARAGELWVALRAALRDFSISHFSLGV